MLLPDAGRFVDGNPAGGTIVTAAQMNAIVGELAGLLALEGIAPQTSGTTPTEHRQLAGMFGAAWVRIRATGTYPQSGVAANSILIDPISLVAGQWPFRVFRNGAWETPPVPFAPAGETPGTGSGETPQGITEVTDAIHGQRGGGDLHALATATSAGFLSPEGHRLLSEIGQNHLRSVESGWQDVASRKTYTWPHGMGELPQTLQVWFRANPTQPPRLMQPMWNPQQRFVGASLEHTNNNMLTYTTGDRVWGGFTTAGYSEFGTGQYLLRATGNVN